MKKVLLSLLIFVLLFSNTGVANAYSNLNEQDQHIQKVVQDDIISKAKIPLKKISINPLNKNEVESIINTYHLQPKTVESIREYLNKCEKGEIKSTSLNIYVPSSDLSQYTYNTPNPYTKTYVGYGGKTYYEEVISYDNTSDSKTVCESTGWSNYLHSTIQAFVSYGIGTFLDTQLSGAWSIASIFTKGIPSDVPANSTFRHEARLHEHKVKKFTYVVENGQYYFGSHVEMSVSYFENTVVIPGLCPTQTGEPANMDPAITPNFDNPDAKAYNTYLGDGWVEIISHHKYKGVTFASI